MPLNKDCSQCKGSGLVADVAQYPKPAWGDYENRPRAGPDPMMDFIRPLPCPTCFPDDSGPVKNELDAVLSTGDHSETPAESLTFAKLLRSKALGYRERADSLSGLAEVAEKLEPGSAAETAFIEFVKTQGVEL